MVGARCHNPAVLDDRVECLSAIDFFGQPVDLRMTISDGGERLRGLRGLSNALADYRVEEISLRLPGGNGPREVKKSLLQKYGKPSFEFVCSSTSAVAKVDDGEMVVRCPENVFHDSSDHYRAEFFVNGQIEYQLGAFSSVVYRNEERASARMEEIKDAVKRGEKYLKDSSIKVGAEGL